MSKYLFLYREKAADDRDCCAYIDSKNPRFECNHYFGSVNLNGACYTGHEFPAYEDIETVLTKAEYNELVQFNKAINDLGYGITVGCGETIDIEPIREMEKVLFAADELTGLIWAAALMRPSKSTKDMELKSLKKKYKSKGFAAGCSREVIERGANQLGWELNDLLDKTLQAMVASEDTINKEMLAG